MTRSHAATQPQRTPASADRLYGTAGFGSTLLTFTARLLRSEISASPHFASAAANSQQHPPLQPDRAAGRRLAQPVGVQ